MTGNHNPVAIFDGYQEAGEISFGFLDVNLLKHRPSLLDQTSFEELRGFSTGGVAMSQCA
jgi:hypothetical protein